MSRFSNAIGIWELNIGNTELELKPKMKDIKSFRNVLLNEKNKSNKAIMFDNFSDYMFTLIQQFYPEDAKVTNEDDELELKVWIEANINVLLEEAMVAFKWTSREDLDKSKKESLNDLKKQMSNV